MSLTTILICLLCFLLYLAVSIVYCAATMALLILFSPVAENHRLKEAWLVVNHKERLRTLLGQDWIKGSTGDDVHWTRLWTAEDRKLQGPYGSTRVSNRRTAISLGRAQYRRALSEGRIRVIQ